jgi:hypothetical protein
MTFDPTIGLGSAILLIVTLFGGTGVWWTMRNRMDQLWDRSSSGAQQHEENQKRMTAIEMQIVRDCVKVEDFRRLEDRMNGRFEKVEHAVNNSATKTVQGFREAIRDLVPNARGRE